MQSVRFKLTLPIMMKIYQYEKGGEKISTLEGARKRYAFLKEQIGGLSS